MQHSEDLRDQRVANEEAEQGRARRPEPDLKNLLMKGRFSGTFKVNKKGNSISLELSE